MQRSLRPREQPGSTNLCICRPSSDGLGLVLLPVTFRTVWDHSVSQRWIMGMNDRSSEILQILPPPVCHTLHSGPDTSLLYVYQSLMKCWQVSPHNGYCVPLIVFNEPWALTMAGTYCRWQLRGPSAAPWWEEILCIMNICNPPLLPQTILLVSLMGLRARRPVAIWSVVSS